MHKNELKNFICCNVKDIDKEVKYLIKRRKKDLKKYKTVMKKINSPKKTTYVQKENLKKLSLQLTKTKNQFENDFEELRLDYKDHKDNMKKWMSPARKKAIEELISEGKKYYKDCYNIQKKIKKMLK